MIEKNIVAYINCIIMDTEPSKNIVIFKRNSKTISNKTIKHIKKIEKLYFKDQKKYEHLQQYQMNRLRK